MENYILLFWVGRHDKIIKKRDYCFYWTNFKELYVDPDAFVCLYFHRRNVKNLDNTPDCEASSLQNKGNNLWTKAIEYILKNSSIF